MTPKVWSGLVAINVALPLLMSFTLDQVPYKWPRLILFLLCVMALTELNLWLQRRGPVARAVMVPIQVLNLTTALLLGSVSFVTGLAGWALLIRLGLRALTG